MSMAIVYLNKHMTAVYKCDICAHCYSAATCDQVELTGPLASSHPVTHRCKDQDACKYRAAVGT